MARRFLHPISASFLLAVVIGTIATRPCLGQSQSDLREETKRLRTLADDLRHEIEALQRQVDVLQADNDRLRALLAAGGGAAPGPGSAAAPAVTIDESVAGASPRALLNALVKEYAETTADAEIGRNADDPVRTAYLRRLERWVSRTNRAHKKPIEWWVEVVASPVRVGRSYVVRLQAVDPVTRVRLGDPFDASLARARLTRLQQLEDRGQLEGPLLLRGTLVPRVHLNQDRLEEGPFDNPRFVGPFVEFGFGIDTTSLIPPGDEDEAPGAKNKAKQSAPGAGSG